ncbi:MAG TPA: aspartate kinase [Bacillota bacterium]
MKILVQKFGGTSVATQDRRKQVVGKIREGLKKGCKLVVVVSAMGRQGDPYATDTLISLATKENSRIKPRELDLLLSCGEIISAVIMVQALRAAGINAIALSGGQAGIITDSHHTQASIIQVNGEKILKLMEEYEVVVVAGFQGVTTEGEITTLGRGGSDTTAVALGAALNAVEVEVYTDVHGVMTADPRVVPEARLLKTMTYSEVSEMAHLGAKVVHPRAVEIAMSARIPLRIKSTFSEEEGTLITDGPSIAGVEIKGDKVVTGLAYIPDVAQVILTADRNLNQDGTALKVFQLLAEAGISVDMIQVSPDRISFIVEEARFEEARAVLADTKLTMDAAKGYAKVAVVGAGMRGVPGVMARVISGLYQAGIPIIQTTDSHTNIACLVKKEDMSGALRALHEEFELGG